MHSSVTRIMCFFVVLAFVLLEVNHIMKVKYGDGIYSVTTFYEQDRNTVDVLILGSSHAFESFNTGVLWDEYGMAAYVLGGSVQPMWNTYYYLREALKTQKPELIILEGYMTGMQDEYTDESRIIKNTYGLNWSTDKLEAMNISTPKDNRKEFLVEYLQYHTRYRELSAGDFLENMGNPLYKNWKGFGENLKTEKLDNPDVSGVGERNGLQEKTEKYYRMIMELAEENNIPLVVVVSPYAGISEKDQALFNSAQDIAAEYGIEFINYNLCYREIGIDYTMDAADVDHLNFRGNRKFSTAVGRYLRENYSISDRRGDGRYQSWQDGADYIRAAMNDYELCNATDELFLVKAQNKDYTLFISADGHCDIQNPNIHKVLNSFGISYGGGNEMWQTGADGVEWYSSEGEAEHWFESGRQVICLKRVWNEDEKKYENSIWVDRSAYRKVDDGVNVIVYSTVTEKVVDVVGFDADQDYKMIR